MGRPPKPSKGVINVRTLEETPDILNELAKECGYLYDDRGSTGLLLDKVAAIARDPNQRLILLGLLKNN